MDEPEYDKVTQASLNGIYVKAQEMDRGHNDVPAPSFAPPGACGGDVEAHASDAQTHASTHASADASDAEGAGHADADAAILVSGTANGADAVAHASTHASDNA